RIRPRLAGLPATASATWGSSEALGPDESFAAKAIVGSRSPSEPFGEDGVEIRTGRPPRTIAFAQNRTGGIASVRLACHHLKLANLGLAATRIA
ncbi:MAG: hypothetical protein WAK93_20010, partial [Solirubrobacteraceae bacterium]